MRERVPAEKAGLRPAPSESYKVLVDRVAASSALQKSARLRELLLFICGRALSEPGVVIHEQEIGVEVFGRAAGYDTAQDNLVRVQASHLRRKLQEYFASEGGEEPVIIEIPKGGYTPVFRKRDDAHTSAAVQRLVWARAYPFTLVITFLAAAGFGASAAWLAFRPAPVSGMEQGLAVARFWQQVLGNGRPACVVLSDTNLVFFQDILQRHLILNEYKQGAFSRVADEEITDRERAAIAKSIISKPSTHIADARLAAKIQGLDALHSIHTDVVCARDFGVAYLQSHNVVLLGTRRANPWLELVENQLNFRTRFEESRPPVCAFENSAPLAGERAAYLVDWGRRGYCRVAFLPNPARNGHMLVISGTDLASTEAGGEFVTGERWIELLRSRLGLRTNVRFPYLEVLLEVEFPVARATKFSLVAHRIM